MASFLRRLLNRHVLWLQKKAEVARFHGIILADYRGKSPHFQTILLGSLQLIMDNDPRRFERVRRHIGWVVNGPLELGKYAEYNAQTRTCVINFQEPEAADDEGWQQTWHIALNAATLVHEATHGEVTARGIAYTPEHRIRIEGLCVSEENRFLRRVEQRAEVRSQVELATVVHHLQCQFDASAWEQTWTASRWQRALSVLKQLPSE